MRSVKAVVFTGAVAFGGLAFGSAYAQIANGEQLLIACTTAQTDARYLDSRLCAFQAPPAPLSPSPKVSQLVSDWRLFFAGQKGLAVSSPPKSLAEEFDRRIVLDQEVRKVFSGRDLTPDEQRAVISVIVADWQAIDTDNDAFLKRSLPADGWFKFSRDGKTVGHNAWLIVQHSPDKAFQRQIVEAMEPLVKAAKRQALTTRCYMIGPSYLLAALSGSAAKLSVNTAGWSSPHWKMKRGSRSGGGKSA